MLLSNKQKDLLELYLFPATQVNKVYDVIQQITATGQTLIEEPGRQNQGQALQQLAARMKSKADQHYAQVYCKLGGAWTNVDSRFADPNSSQFANGLVTDLDTTFNGLGIDWQHLWAKC